jgi:environmental stress-induced protein Ves
MPWKNGGGSTEEITRDAGTGLDGFGWRLSIADIAESGGFSTFAGYQRIITVLQGDGMTLSSMARHATAVTARPVCLQRREPSVLHAARWAIRDFNLIYAPQRYHARLQWLDGEQRFFSSASTVLVFSVSEQSDVSVDHRVQPLGRHDCLQLEANDGLLDVTIKGLCCVIELTSRG